MSHLDCNNYFDPVYQRCLSIVLSININSSIQTLTKCSFYKINVFPQPHLTLLSLSILSSVLDPNKCHFHEHIPNNLRNSTPSHLPWKFLIHSKAVVLLLESNLMSSITNQPKKKHIFSSNDHILTKVKHPTLSVMYWLITKYPFQIHHLNSKPSIA